MKRSQSLSKTGFSPADKRNHLIETEGTEETEEISGDLSELQMDESVKLRTGPSGPSRTSRVSNESVGSLRPDLDRTFTFAKEKQEGPWRDKLTVDIFKIGDQDFKGTIKVKEAKIEIYKKALNLKRENLHAIEIEFRGHPVMTFRLKQLINVDLEFTRDTFTLTREGTDGPITLQGRIRGVRPVSGVGTFVKGDNTRIKIKNCKWSLDENDIKEWLNYYGSVITPITEETHRESDDETSEDDDEEEQDCPPLGTGNLWVTMKLAWDIPQFLPMMGRKIEIYHRGIKQTCVNCYQQGHKRRDCQNQRVQWLDYVADFIETNELRPQMYGRWFQITEELRKTYRQAAEQSGSKPSEESGMPGSEMGDDERRKEDQTEDDGETSGSYRKSKNYQRNVGNHEDKNATNNKPIYSEVLKTGTKNNEGAHATVSAVAEEEENRIEKQKEAVQAAASAVAEEEGDQSVKQNEQAAATEKGSGSRGRGRGRGRGKRQ